MRSEIETRARLDAVDIYGLSEVMGPGVASECVESKDGPVIWEDHFYPEIIDPVTGAVLPDGSVGELVFTSLTKEAMPVIRYRTRDLTRLLPPTSRSMRRMGGSIGFRLTVGCATLKVQLQLNSRPITGGVMTKSKSTLRATGGSITTTVPADVVQELGARAGQSLQWVREPDGAYRILLDEPDPILEAAEEVLAMYRPVFAALAREDGRG